MEKHDCLFARKILAAVLTLALGAAGSSALGAEGPVGIRLKFAAGGSLLFNGGGDLKDFGTASVGFASEWGGGAFRDAASSWKNPSSFADWRAEVVLTYGRYFGLGFGVGQATLSSRGDYAMTFDYYASRYTAFQIDQDWVFHHRFEVSMVPLELNFYGFLPLGKVTLYAFAGPGFYLGSLTHDYERRTYYRHDQWFWPPENPEFVHSAREVRSQESRAEKANCNRFGFQGGLGFELGLTPWLSIGLESFFRTVSFNDWQGSFSSTFASAERFYDNREGWSDGESSSGSVAGQGHLWSFENGPGISDLSGQPGMFILESEPVGEDYANVRNAAINFNAAGVLLTMSFRF